MSGALKIHLKANERIFINGAVLRVDRKVSLEFLNDVTFLLETHVMQQEDATTPLRQLYYVVQSMLMEPSTKDLALAFYEDAHQNLIDTLTAPELIEGLLEVRQAVDGGRVFEALKKIRTLLPLEDEILAGSRTDTPDQAAVA